MKNIIDTLKHSVLFCDFSQQEISEVLESIDYGIKTYTKDEIIAIENDKCINLGIVLDGSIQIQKIFESGKLITISRLYKGEIFGEVVIFSDTNQYPATIVSAENTNVMFIAKKEIIKLCNLNTHFLDNFIGSLSDRILLLNKKLRNLSYHTVRQKVSSYLLEEYNRQNKTTIDLTFSRKEIAEHLGIPRPSLSREFMNMRDEGLIDFHKNIIKILNLDGIEESLFE